jgi:D-psicose/D-tagatose/L-ribulose 3-epimerase
MPRFGASSWVWTQPFDPAADVALVDKLAALGGDHFELGGEAAAAPPSAFRELQRALASNAMSSSVCAVYRAELDLASPDAVVRRAGFEHARACLEIAGSLGAGIVVGAFCGSGGRKVLDGAEREERISRGAVELHEIGELAHAADVTIAVEGLNRYENNLVNTLEDIVDLVQRADHPNVAALLDLFHASIEQADLIGAIRNAGPWIAHCHAVDNTRGAPGSGHLPWAEIVAALRGAGYDGALVIECFNPDNPDWAIATSSWRRLADTQDELARRGIAFLRAAWEASGLTVAGTEVPGVLPAPQ